MDMIYFEQPLFVLFPVVLLTLQFITFILNRKKQLSPTFQTVFAGVIAVLYAVFITIILLNGGTLSDVLVLVLLGGSFSLALSPNPNKKEED